MNLGEEKIGKLILKFSIPCIISLLVNSLYNIVDQIFIGWNVGYLGNGATNVVFPLTMICLAFSLMFGDGGSAFLSLKLGEKKEKEAAKGVGNAIVLSIIVSTIICIVTLIFLPQILNIFGCTDALKPYALDYGYIIAIGLPFMMIGTTLNSIIRADGNPRFAMITMISGALLNVVLDYIFMFHLNMGVQGAAIATVISQFFTAVLNINKIRKFKSIKVTKDIFKLDFEISKKVTTLGISSFITEMSIVAVITCENNMLSKCGANSEFGSEIPITVLGIVMKISQILNSIVIGIAAGTQPIWGYNYGAGKYDRVKKALKIVLGVSISISTIALILFQTIPDKLIALFGNGDEKYIEFACLSFRTYLLLTICNGVQIPSGIFFQAIGKSGKSAILSLSRQILFLLPSMIILGNVFGLIGILYSGPVADGLAFVISISLLIHEIICLKNKIVNPSNIEENESTENNIDNNIIITISREYGSGGRYVGKLLAKELGIKLYDEELIKIVSDESGLSASYIEKKEQNMKDTVFANFNSQYYNNMTNDDNLFIAESKAIKEVADKGPCIIIGRCADYILKDKNNVFSVFLYNSEESKINRAVKYYGMNEKNAIKEIKKINKAREAHYKYYTSKEWKDFSNYDLAINVDKFGVEKTTKIIGEIIKDRKESVTTF